MKPQQVHRLRLVIDVAADLRPTPLPTCQAAALAKTPTSLWRGNELERQCPPGWWALRKPKCLVNRTFGFDSQPKPYKTMSELNPTYYQTMERDELVRLAGEQALLKKETSERTAAQQRDIQALRNISLSISTGTDWHARGIELLNRIKERETTIAINHQRLSELSALTGI